MHSAKTTQEVWWPKKACEGKLALTISAKYITNMDWMQHAMTWIKIHCMRTKTVTSSVLAVQFVGQAEQLISLLSPSLFEMQQQTALLFMLGPSPLRPFEVYCMSCSACMEAAAELSDQGQARAQQTAKRVLRSMIMNTAAYPEGRASVGRPLGLNAQPPCLICKLSHAFARACSGMQYQKYMTCMKESHVLCRCNKALRALARTRTGNAPAWIPAKAIISIKAAQGLAGKLT